MKPVLEHTQGDEVAWNDYDTIVWHDEIRLDTHSTIAHRIVDAAQPPLQDHIILHWYVVGLGWSVLEACDAVP
jgi:hypothetical protein